MYSFPVHHKRYISSASPLLSCFSRIRPSRCKPQTPPQAVLVLNSRQGNSRISSHFYKSPISKYDLLHQITYVIYRILKTKTQQQIHFASLYKLTLFFKSNRQPMPSSIHLTVHVVSSTNTIISIQSLNKTRGLILTTVHCLS